MAQRWKLYVALVVMVFATHGGIWVDGAGVHHVVGGDRGWDSSSNVGSWSSGRIFRVGDKIWFTYSAALENIVELRSDEEYSSCNLANPIRKFTDGLDIIPLEGLGIRYFASGNPESCKNGLKLHVDVQPHVENESRNSSPVHLAEGPTVPSLSAQLTALSCGLGFGLIICFVGL